MGEPRSIEQRMAEAQERWPGLMLRKKTRDEAAGPCPWCGGQDRFRVWSEGNYECRPLDGHCGRSGWIDENDPRQLSREEKLELRVAALERKQEEHERRLSKLEEMHGLMHVADFYYGNLRDLDNGALEYWDGEGMTMDTIDRYKLGYCSRCPTDRDRRDSYTIPVVIGGKLYNIRHRLREAGDGDKYRPHMAGLPSVLFNADYLYEGLDQIIVCEGEKKSIICAQEGFPNVGIMGKSGFDPAWRVKFADFRKVYVFLDPDATDQAAEIAALFDGRGYVVAAIDKLDDMIVDGATAEDIRAMLKHARRV